MTRGSGIVTGIVVLGLVAGAVFLHRQSAALPISQPASVMQMMGRTRLTVRYSRPSARGRLLFGGLVPYGKPWDPGADQATTFATTESIHLGGQPLAAGVYSVWAIPDSADWTLILSRAAHVYHIPYPSGHDALRIQVRPTSGPFMETLAYYFPDVDSTHAELVLHWGTTMIDVPITPARAAHPSRVP